METTVRDIMEKYRDEIMDEGIEQGMEKGLLQGKLNILVEMVKDKIITSVDAAKRIGISEQEFLALANIN